MEQYYSVRELATRWHYAEITIRVRMAKGDIPYTKVGKRVLISKAWVESYEKEHAVKLSQIESN